MLTKAEVETHFTNQHELPSSGRIHFVGIGGAGLSALARVLLHMGREVSGSDIKSSTTTVALAQQGAKITIGHSTGAIEGSSLVVVSDAINLQTNPEYLEARRLEIPTLRRSQLMSELVRSKKLIAVAGTHGKSTIVALLGQLLERLGADPLVINGAELPAWGGNVRFGRGEWAVVEACEAFNGMLDLSPDLIVLANLEPDHLEFHGSFENLKGSMTRFVKSLRPGGALVYGTDDSGAAEIAASATKRIGYGMSGGELTATYSHGLIVNGSPIRTNVIGKHNGLNLLGAITAACQLGYSVEAVLSAAEGVTGCKRRLEIVAEADGKTIIQDYAHHPSELRASLDAVREQFPGRRLVCVYQPLTYSRVQNHFDEFVHELAKCDAVVMTDIFSSREEPIPGVSSVRIFEALERSGTNAKYVPSVFDLPRVVHSLLRPGDVVLDTGAGMTERFGQKLVELVNRQTSPLKVAVFGGGFSAEREVSKLGALLVSAALRRRGYDVDLIDPADLLYSPDRMGSFIANRPDIVFPVLHGPRDEDGRLQSFLELLGVPYVGSGVLASALAMDKSATKLRLREAGIRVPTGVIVTSPDEPVSLPLPFVVKPNAQGSTVGMTIVRDEAAIYPAIEKALRQDPLALIEECLEGTEITVPVLGEIALPSVEIAPKSGFYDFASKYVPGETLEISPARISETLEDRARQTALLAHKLLNCQDISRTDMIIVGDDIYVLEINTLPGMTPTSLVPKSAAAAGLNYEDLCERILECALVRHAIQKTKAN